MGLSSSDRDSRETVRPLCPELLPVSAEGHPLLSQKSEWVVYVTLLKQKTFGASAVPFAFWTKQFGLYMQQCLSLYLVFI